MIRSDTWRSLSTGFVGVMLAALVLLGWREWATWVEVRNFVVPIMAAQRAQAAQARPAAPSSATPAEPSK